MGYIKAGFAIAAIDNHANGDRLGAVFAAFSNRLDNAAPSGDHVFNNQYLLAWFKFEIPPKFQLVVYFFQKEETQVELAGDFLPDDKAAHRRADHGRRAVITQHGHHDLGQAGDLVHILADLGTLKKVATVETRAENKMALKQGTTVAENLNNFVVFVYHGLETEGQSIICEARSCLVIPREGLLIGSILYATFAASPYS